MGIDFIKTLLVVSGGMLAGNELAIVAFVHPAFGRISDGSHAEASREMARVLGRMMPFWYALQVVLSVWVAWRSAWAAVPAAVAGIYAASVVLTVAVLVPINNKITSMDIQQPPADWKVLETRWDRVHSVRVLMLTAAAFLSR